MNPRRAVQEASIAIHGIRPELLIDQPTIRSRTRSKRLHGAWASMHQAERTTYYARLQY